VLRFEREQFLGQQVLARLRRYGVCRCSRSSVDLALPGSGQSDEPEVRLEIRRSTRPTEAEFYGISRYLFRDQTPVAASMEKRVNHDENSLAFLAGSITVTASLSRQCTHRWASSSRLRSGYLCFGTVIWIIGPRRLARFLSRISSQTQRPTDCAHEYRGSTVRSRAGSSLALLHQGANRNAAVKATERAALKTPQNSSRYSRQPWRSCLGLNGRGTLTVCRFARRFDESWLRRLFTSNLVTASKNLT